MEKEFCRNTRLWDPAGNSTLAHQIFFVSVLKAFSILLLKLNKYGAQHVVSWVNSG